VAVRFGVRAAQLEYLALTLVACTVPVLLYLRGEGGLWILLPLLTLPLAAGLTRQVFTWKGPPLNRTLAGTARLVLLFALLLAAGIVLGVGS
jgi:1,4-dihydroxy-2-naphthoate octaprenyltransferase